jgi:uncharacterized membrane protein YcaP (DUF421 family)
VELVLRTLFVFAILWLFFRIAGKRALTKITTFDFVVLLIISESTQQALVGHDFSVTGALTVVATFLLLDIGLSLLKQRSTKAGKVLDGVPVVILENGRLLRDRMEKERVDESEILMAARERLGLERLDQIQYAILEQDGEITVTPWPEPTTPRPAPAGGP